MLTATRGRGRPLSARWTAALLTVLALTGCTSVVPGSADYAPPGSGGLLVREPCPDSEFQCVTIGVPADHFTPGSDLWEVTFALHRPAQQSEGVVVVATRGPGSSGIAVADHRRADMPDTITDH